MKWIKHKPSVCGFRHIQHFLLTMALLNKINNEISLKLPEDLKKRMSDLSRHLVDLCADVQSDIDSQILILKLI